MIMGRNTLKGMGAKLNGRWGCRWGSEEGKETKTENGVIGGGWMDGFPMLTSVLGCVATETGLGTILTHIQY
jgi:hypothetical protein